jgi:hypothetical protein
MQFRPAPKSAPIAFSVANGDPARATHIAAIDGIHTYALCRRWPQGPTIIRESRQDDPQVSLKVRVPYFCSAIEIRAACGWTGTAPSLAGETPLVLVGVSVDGGSSYSYVGLRPPISTGEIGTETPLGSERWVGTTEASIGEVVLGSGHVPISMSNKPQEIWVTWEMNDVTILRCLWIDYYGLTGERLEVLS